MDNIQQPNSVHPQPDPNSLGPNVPLPAPLPPPPKRRFNFFSGDGDHQTLHSLFSTVLLFGSAFLIAILLNTFVIQSYQVDGESMEKTLQNNDRLIVNKIPRTIARIDGHSYVPHRGDIIIFNEDSLPGFVGQKQLIKRVIGLPGERVVVADGKVRIYNDMYPNGFNPDKITGYHIDQTFTSQNVDYVLQKDELFVLGDNRANSLDSRYIGPIKTKAVVAKLVLRILPLSGLQAY